MQYSGDNSGDKKAVYVKIFCCKTKLAILIHHFVIRFQHIGGALIKICTKSTLLSPVFSSRTASLWQFSSLHLTEIIVVNSGFYGPYNWWVQLAPSEKYGGSF